LLEFAFRDRCVSLHECRDDLAPLFVRKTDDGHFGYRWVEGKAALDLDRRNILAAGDDHVVDAARHEQVAVVVDVTRVTGEVPALAQRFRVCVWASPIALERLVARQQRDDLALFIGGREFVDRPSLETDDLDTLVDARLAGRPGFGDRVLFDGESVDFRTTIVIDEKFGLERLVQLFEQAFGHRRPSEAKLADARDVCPG